MALPATQLPADAERPERSQPSLVFSGGEPPGPRAGVRRAGNGVIGMAIFLGTEVMIFTALVSAFLILKAGSATWPPPGQPRLPAGVTGVNTLVLLASAYTMWRASPQAEKRSLLNWLALTAALGTTFLVVQGSEWAELLAHGLRVSSGVYGATFYTVIGCHALHVVVAVVTLLVLLARVWRADGTRRRAEVEVCRLYWFFVVGIWPVLYVLVYLA